MQSDSWYVSRENFLAYMPPTNTTTFGKFNYETLFYKFHNQPLFDILISVNGHKEIDSLLQCNESESKENIYDRQCGYQTYNHRLDINKSLILMGDEIFSTLQAVSSQKNGRKILATLLLFIWKVLGRTTFLSSTISNNPSSDPPCHTHCSDSLFLTYTIHET